MEYVNAGVSEDQWFDCTCFLGANCDNDGDYNPCIAKGCGQDCPSFCGLNLSCPTPNGAKVSPMNS